MSLVVNMPARTFTPTQYHLDYCFGKEKEIELEDRISEFFNDVLHPSKNRFCAYDWMGASGIKYELKSRKNAYEVYPTTMVPADKVREGRTIFLFSFTDGFYYIEYDKEVFSTFKCEEFRRWRKGTRDIEKPYYYIPIEKLLKIF